MVQKLGDHQLRLLVYSIGGFIHPRCGMWYLYSSGWCWSWANESWMTMSLLNDDDEEGGGHKKDHPPIKVRPESSYKLDYNSTCWCYNPSYPFIRSFIGVLIPCRDFFSQHIPCNKAGFFSAGGLFGGLGGWKPNFDFDRKFTCKRSMYLKMRSKPSSPSAHLPGERRKFGGRNVDFLVNLPIPDWIVGWFLMGS